MQISEQIDKNGLLQEWSCDADQEKQKNKSEQQSRLNQQMNEYESQNHYKSILKPSPNIEQYMRDFVRNRRISPILSYMQIFHQQGITYLSDSTIPSQIQLEHIYSSKSSRIIHYNVRISYFLVRIKLFNITKQDKYKLQFNNQINHGMFGTVYSIQNPFAKQQQVAIKLIPYNNQSYRIIENAIKQYALMKVLAAISVGPPTIKLFGYDLVTTHNGVMFSMERGVALNLWISSGLSKQMIHQGLESLQRDLLLLHSLNICHNDIKPPNIIYSPKLAKLIYIDFGFTDVRPQGLGYMGMCHAKGSLYYCSQQMKNIFLTTGQGYVDTYYNDYICLKKTKQFILNNYLFNEPYDKTHNINQCYLVNDNHDGRQNGSQLDCFADIMTIYLAYIIEKIDIKQFTAFINQRSWTASIIQQNMKKICIFFLQAQLSLGLWHMFNKFSQTFINDNHLLNPQVKRLVQQSLKPYFRQFLSSTFTQNPDSTQVILSNIQFQKKILKRYDKIDSNILKNKALQLTKKGLQEDQSYELDLGQENEQVLNIHFARLRSLHYYLQKELVESLITVFNRKRWYLLNQKDISLLKECFKLANINISYNKISNPSLYELYRLYLQLFSKYIKFMHQSFNLKIIITTSAKYYYQETPALINLANNLIEQKFPVNNNDNNNSRSNNNDKNNINQKSLPNQEYNYIEILQLYIFLSQKMFMAYEKNLNLFKEYIEIFESKVKQCLELKQIFEKVSQLKIVNCLVQILIERYVIFTYEAAIQGYVIAYHQCDYQSYFNIHRQLNQIKTRIYYQNYQNIASQRLQQIKVAQYIDEFINLMTFVDLIPITHSSKFLVIQRFQLLVKRIEWFQKLVNITQITALNFNAKLKLFSLYINRKYILKAIKLGNDIINQSAFTKSQLNIFIVQSLFKKLNNSNQLKLMSKKLQNLNFSEFFSKPNSKQLTMEKSLIMLQYQTSLENGQKHPNKIPIIQESQFQISCKRNYIEKVQKTWINCISDKWYEKKFAEKLFLLRTIIGKLIGLMIGVRGYVQEYFKEIEKYQQHLSEKIMKSKDLIIYLYEMGQESRSKQFIWKDMHREFMIIELQQFLKYLLNFQNKISEQGLIEECWVRYQVQYNRRFNEVYCSEAIRQCHAELKCKFNQHIYRKNYFRWKLLNFQIQHQKHVNVKQEKYRMQDSKRQFEESAVSYIRNFNKELLDHDFYNLILVGLVQKTMQLQQYSSQWARRQIRSYFIYCIRNQQIFYFFYYNPLTKIYITQLLSIAAMQLIQTTIKKGQDSLYRKSIQGEEYIDDLLITYIFKSFNEFIDDNSCLTYEEIFVNMAIQLKNHLIKYLSQSTYSINNKYTPIVSIQQFIRTIIHRIQNSVLQNISNDRCKSNIWVMVFIIKTLLVEYNLKIQQEELKQLTLHLFILEHYYHTVTAQVYYVLNLQHTYQQLTLDIQYSQQELEYNSLSVNNDNIHNLNQFLNRKQRKNYYAVNKLFRKYKLNNLINNQTKYLNAKVIRKIKERFVTKISNETNHILKIDKKITNYVVNNFGDNIFV